MNVRKGFTLIELLVVVAIIGILATIVISSLNSARSKARDSRRHADIKTIQNALELYYSEHGRYPHRNWGNVAPAGWYANSGDSSWEALETTLGTKLPRDPVNDTPVTTSDWPAGSNKKFDYVYRGDSTQIGCTMGEAYFLVYRLEKGDATGEEQVGVRRCDNGNLFKNGNGAITVGVSPAQ